MIHLALSIAAFLFLATIGVSALLWIITAVVTIAAAIRKE